AGAWGAGWGGAGRGRCPARGSLGPDRHRATDVRPSRSDPVRRRACPSRPRRPRASGSRSPWSPREPSDWSETVITSGEELAMKTIQVNYDLSKPGRKYDGLFEYLSSFDGWARV